MKLKQWVTIDPKFDGKTSARAWMSKDRPELKKDTYPSGQEITMFRCKGYQDFYRIPLAAARKLPCAEGECVEVEVTIKRSDQ